MSQKYIILCLIFQLLVEINCQITQFKPLHRYVHTSTLINNKLYILGGTYYYDEATIIGNQFFYLDVSAPFNTQNLLWQDLSSINTVPPHMSATSVKGGADNSTLFLYGGVTSDTITALPALVYTFDPQSNKWSTPEITGANTFRKGSSRGIVDYNGKMYLWGGLNDGKSVNDMVILDTINLNWGIGSSVNAPFPSINYGAVLLPDNNIIYIGGYNFETKLELPLNQVYVYNTISNSWDTRTTIGTIPSARSGFSTVLGLDGQRAIIFGGTTGDLKPFDIEDSLHVLDLNNFEWYIPKTSGQMPKSRMYHTANIIEKYMVMSFGKGYDQLVESDILLLDISDNDEYKWTNTFELSPPSSSETQQPIPTPVPYSSANTAMIVAIVSIIVGFLLAVVCFFLLKRYMHKQRQNNSIPTPGSESNQGREQGMLQENENMSNNEPIYNQEAILNSK